MNCQKSDVMRSVVRNEKHTDNCVIIFIISNLNDTQHKALSMAPSIDESVLFHSQVISWFSDHPPLTFSHRRNSTRPCSKKTSLTAMVQMVCSFSFFFFCGGFFGGGFVLFCFYLGRNSVIIQWGTKIGKERKGVPSGPTQKLSS